MPYTYVTPNSKVWLLRDVPLSNDYEHTVLFKQGNNQTVADAQATQKAAFINAPQGRYSPILFTNQMYKRVNKNTLRIKANYDDIYMCNYMLFENYTSNVLHPTKTYYAFILELNYVAEGTTEIIYEIDVMQTWMFDYQLLPSFVEREHSKYDAVGYNTVEEPFNVGEIVKSIPLFFKGNTNNKSIVNGEYSVVVVAPWKYTYQEGVDVSDSIEYVTNSFYGHMFSPLCFNVFHIVGESSSVRPDWFDLQLLLVGVNNIPAALSEKQKNEIVAIYTVPTNFIEDATFTPADGYYYKTLVPKYTWKYRDIDEPSSSSTDVWIDVKNKKLFTYPFSYLYVTNSDGAESIYKFELFKQGAFCEFGIIGTPGCPPQIKLVPKNYRFAYDNANELVSTDFYNTSEAMILQNFPMNPWTTDTFKAWLAQNGTRMLLTPLTKIGSAAIMANTGHPLMATMEGVNAATSVVNSLADMQAASMMPDDSHGIASGHVSLQSNDLGFTYQYARVKDQTAKILDDFFDKYGYATKEVKVPNRDVRVNWCYTKTAGCLIKGTSPTGLPAAAEDKIVRIYDKGITFWKFLETIGNYNLPNDCVAELT